MANNRKMLGYDEIVSALQDLCQSMRTGTMFITTWDNHSARFVLLDGKIVSCNYSMKRGLDSLPLLKTIKAGSFRFADGVFSAITDIPLPPTKELLNEIQLAEPDAAIPVSDPDFQSSTQAATSWVSSNAAPLLVTVNKELTKYLGPIAKIILEDYIDEFGTPANNGDLKALLNAMAKELRNASNAEAFISAVSKSIG